MPRWCGPLAQGSPQVLRPISATVFRPIVMPPFHRLSDSWPSVRYRTAAVVLTAIALSCGGGATAIPSETPSEEFTPEPVTTVTPAQPQGTTPTAATPATAVASPSLVASPTTPPTPTSSTPSPSPPASPLPTDTVPSASPPSPTPLPTSTLAPDLAVGPNVGDLAPDFILTLPDEETVTLASLREQDKPFVLFFFTTW